MTYHQNKGACSFSLSLTRIQIAIECNARADSSKSRNLKKTEAFQSVTIFKSKTKYQNWKFLCKMKMPFVRRGIKLWLSLFRNLFWFQVHHKFGLCVQGMYAFKFKIKTCSYVLGKSQHLIHLFLWLVKRKGVLFETLSIL